MLDQKRLDALQNAIHNLKQNIVGSNETVMHQAAQLQAAEKDIEFVRETLKLDVPDVEDSLTDKLAELEHELIDLQQHVAGVPPQPGTKPPRQRERG